MNIEVGEVWRIVDQWEDELFVLVLRPKDANGDFKTLILFDSFIPRSIGMVCMFQHETFRKRGSLL